MLEDVLTLAETQERIGKSRSRTQQLVGGWRGEAPTLPSRAATPTEIGALLDAGRLGGYMRGKGVVLVDRAAVEAYIAQPAKRGPGHPVTTGAGLRRKDRRKAEPTTPPPE